jgi:hypothetical protein
MIQADSHQVSLAESPVLVAGYVRLLGLFGIIRGFVGGLTVRGLHRLRDGAVIDDIQLTGGYDVQDIIRRTGQLG